MKNIKLLLLVFIITSFNNCDTHDGSAAGASASIAEAKKRGVFIQEYTSNPNPYVINDSLQITVKEAWLEKTWYHGSTDSETVIVPNFHYQLCINSTEENIIGIDLKWAIGIDATKYLRSDSKNSLLGDFKYIPRDTIEYKVQKGTNFGSDTTRDIIGKFVLVKK